MLGASSVVDFEPQDKDDMKGKADISNNDLPHMKNVDSLAYHKVIEDIKRESKREKYDSIGQESVDFETAIAEAGYGKFNYFLLLIAVPAACSSGFVTGAVSLILPAAGCDLELTSVQKGLLNSAPYAGMVLSAYFWGFLSDAFGRQRLLMIGFLVDALMSFCASLSPTFNLMMMFKFFSGIMVCGPYSIFMAYISEVFMDKRRDVAVLSAGIFSALGNIFQPALAWYLMPLDVNWELFSGIRVTSWRLFLLACGVPSLICGISCAFCVESPKFLMEQGRKEEALKVFKKIYTINTGLPNNTYPVHRLHDCRRPSAILRERIPKKKSFGDIMRLGRDQTLLLLSQPYLPRALFLFFIQFGGMSSLNVLRLWLPQLFTLVEMSYSQNVTSTVSGREPGMCEIFVSTASLPEAGCDNLQIKPEVFSNMIWVNAGTLFAHSVFILIVKYLGKKVIITGTTLISAACAVLISLLPTSYVVPLASLFVAVLNVTFFSVIGTVVEIFPTKIRATTVSLTMMFGRIGVLAANIGVASIMYTHCDLIFYIISAVLSIIGISSVFLPTTSLEQAEALPDVVKKQNETSGESGKNIVKVVQQSEVQKENSHNSSFSSNNSTKITK